MSDEGELLSRVALRISKWYESKPRTFWSADNEKILNVFAALGCSVHCLQRSIRLGYPNFDAPERAESEAALARALDELGCILRGEEVELPCPLQAAAYTDWAVMLLSAVIEVLSERLHGSEIRMFQEPLFRKLKVSRDRAAHLKEIFVMKPGAVLEVMECMMPSLEDYLISHGFNTP